MKVFNEKCTNCGAPLVVSEDMKRCECRFCGAVYTIDDETQRIHYEYTDTAKVKREENNRLRIFANAEHYDRKHLLMILFAMWGLTLVFVTVSLCILF